MKTNFTSKHYFQSDRLIPANLFSYPINLDNKTIILMKDQAGFILTKEEASKVIEAWLESYNYITEQEIIENNHVMERQFDKNGCDCSLCQEYIDELNKQRSITQNNTKKRGYLYLMKNVSNLYKIGITNDIKRRLKDIQYSSGENIELIHSFLVDNCREKEIELHNLFERKRNIGEWFALDEEDVKYICSLNC